MIKNDIPHRLSDILERIKTACHHAGRPENSVSLVAVSKFHPVEAVRVALASGQRLFGENRVQEAAGKFPALRADYPDLKLHLIGGLQTNKALEACRIADMIESLDRPALGLALEKAAQKLGRLPELLVQVNLGDEPQKYGVPLKDARQFIEDSLTNFGTHIKGLMAIPPQEEDPVPHFRRLVALAQYYHLPVCSMGMSTDFEAAIAEGATIVRVGSAIFGPRQA